MRFDIEEGNFCEALLEKINSDNKTKNNSPCLILILLLLTYPSPDCSNNLLIIASIQGWSKLW